MRKSTTRKALTIAIITLVPGAWIGYLGWIAYKKLKA